VAKDHQVEVVYVHVNAEGEVSLDHLKEILAAGQKKTLVSIIHGNNEIGTIQDLQAIENLCEEYNAYLHSDTVQTIGHHSFNLNERKIHFLSGSAHKFHGPKGVGFLYMNGDAILEPFVDGGAQERNMRAGTENVYGIEGMAKALDLSYQRFDQDRAFILKLRSQLKEGLIRLIPDISFNGKQDNNYLYTVLSAQFPQRIASDMLLMNLDVNGIAASGGSACSSGADQGSHVIRSIKPEDQGTTVRFSFSSMNTESEIEQTLKVLNQIIGGA
jgi:cysteine desulfurase